MSLEWYRWAPEEIDLQESLEDLEIDVESLEIDVVVERLANIIEWDAYTSREIEVYLNIIWSKILGDSNKYDFFVAEFESKELPKEFLDSMLIDYIFNYNTKEAIVDIIDEQWWIHYGSTENIRNYREKERIIGSKQTDISELQWYINEDLDEENKINFSSRSISWPPVTSKDLDDLRTDMLSKWVDENRIEEYMQLQTEIAELQDSISNVENSALYAIFANNNNIDSNRDLSNVSATLENIFGSEEHIVSYLHSVQETESIICDIVNSRPSNASEWNEVWQQNWIHWVLTEWIRHMTGLDRWSAWAVSSVGMVVWWAYLWWKVLSRLRNKPISTTTYALWIVWWYFFAKNMASWSSQEDLDNNRREILEWLRENTTARESLKLMIKQGFWDKKVEDILDQDQNGKLSITWLIDSNNRLSEEYRENQFIISLINRAWGDIDDDGMISWSDLVDTQTIIDEVKNVLLTWFSMLGVNRVSYEDKRNQKIDDLISEFDQNRELEHREFAIRDQVSQDLNVAIDRLWSNITDPTKARQIVTNFNNFLINEIDLISELWKVWFSTESIQQIITRHWLKARELRQVEFEWEETREDADLDESWDEKTTTTMV